jgi:hypothetical protein
MKAPEQCVLWENPELLLEPGRGDRFERIEEYVDNSNSMRRLLKCKECGQLYFYEFREEINWSENGGDPQWRTYIPVYSDSDIEILKATGQYSLLKHGPRLNLDWPSRSNQKVFWTGRSNHNQEITEPK